MKQAGQKSSKEGLPKQRKGPKRTEECRLNVPTHIWEQDAGSSSHPTRTKWAVVFAILIGGYAIAVPLYKKVPLGVSWERKRDIAKSRDHVIKASLADKHPTGEVSRYNTINGEERQYTAYFKHPSTPPLYLYLYYVNDPDKLFSCEEYHYKNHKGIFLLPVIFLPWILAGVALVLLGVDLPGF